MANLQIRIDDELKNKAQQIASAMGMDLTTAVRVFLKQLVHERAFPFRPDVDPFYSPENQKILKESIDQLGKGQVISKTINELVDKKNEL
ncbi:type II toxin-antitoxin system RelB/DinJ family antitoxin [Entomobacter blattae]|uniref:RelB antitoxin n=1 Tax=Entomobacter blattae TaxID=2762277 RepID=A0A7H1NRN4_9PROT|nr:type II toxin-antitoxin system RelB/DinJ family antitoxin [Entomobacter blattae]QNT78444.1 RelB antitoxin [Entomobacter blattae]